MLARLSLDGSFRTRHSLKDLDFHLSVLVGGLEEGLLDTRLFGVVARIGDHDEVGFRPD